MMDEEIRQVVSEVREMKQMCGNINMKLTNIVTQRGQDWKKKLEAEYQRGLDDAWEVVKALFQTLGTESACVIMKNDNVHGAINRLKAYEEKQKADDEIKVGDVLEHTVSGYTSKAIFLEKIEDDEDWYKCLFWTGCGLAILSYPKSQFKRIGKHFDIASILEDMRND